MVPIGNRVLPEACLALPLQSISQTLWFPGSLPGLNELVAARISASRTFGKNKKRWNAYSELKRKTEEQLLLAIKACRLRPVSSGVFHYHFSCFAKRRDPSNLSAGAIKLIEDALVRGGILPNDGWGQVLGIIQTFSHNKARPGVLLTMYSPGAVLEAP